MAKVVGGFTFRDEGDGCLTSKYVNNRSQPFTECCKRADEANNSRVEELNGFVGAFRTTWLEVDGGPVTVNSGHLTIGRPINGRYDLRWISDGGQRYDGVGMIVDRLLVGSYWSAR